MIRTVLLVDDDRAVREALGQTLELADLNPVLAGSTIEAKDHVGRDFPGVVVSDLRMPGKDGFALLAHVRGLDPELPVILLTGQGDVPTAVRGMAEGAFGFLEKPCAPGDLLEVIHKALRSRTEVLEARGLSRRIAEGDAAARLIFGISAQSETLRSRIRAAARATGAVLVTGEPGTGISKVAEVLHLVSPAARRPFVKLSASATDAPALAEAFSRADGGTIFLDEVTDLTPAAQFALLELIEGDARSRAVAGTHHDLARAARAGRFHPDLSLRLDALRLRIPALRERPEDIPVMFRRYVAQASEQADLTPPEIDAAMLDRLMAQDWPGNARALMNAAMRFALGVEEPPPEGGEGLAEQMARVERTLLEQALRRHGGNATVTAQALKLPRKTFYDKLARHDLHPEDYRRSG
ncbi:sigma-54-dependent transcriptional regulator [Acidimangrovimonas sediminis]|uniref:sigma-54-dependent transcriptional regulator n=1 Tax=Acidimangrovimonas sediminis TaxID=2056283 RepID=UPI000C809E75|nr:sigma-54 dependent transcriptional regulator [Acidimangrovimonas sediminis]